MSSNEDSLPTEHSELPSLSRTGREPGSSHHGSVRVRRRHRGRRRMTAFHEAGHCLARWYFGHTFLWAIVRPVEEALDHPIKDRRGRLVDCEGSVEAYSIWSPLTGHPAHLAATEDPVCRANFSEQVRISAEMALVEGFAGAIAESRYRRCSFLSALCEGGDGDIEQIQRILEAWSTDLPNAEEVAQTRARALVRSSAGWTAITMMAEHLFTHGKLDGDAGAAMCEAASQCESGDIALWWAHWPPMLKAIRSGWRPLPTANR